MFSWLRRLLRFGRGRRWRVPLLLRWHEATRTAQVSVDVNLLVQTGPGTFEPVPFRVDSGATVTNLPLARARRLGLPVAGPLLTWTMNTATGPVSVQGHVGTLDVWLTPERDHPPFTIPVLFPDIPAAHRPLLGLNVVDQLGWAFNGSFRRNEPWGVLLLDDLRRA
jgi:hypothetical protein